MDDLFAHTTGPRDARILIVGEAWGLEEAAAQLPFVGPSGKLLNSLLKDAGLDRSDCLCTNIVNARPPRVVGAESNDFRGFLMATSAARAAKFEPTNGLYADSIVREGLAHLERQILAVRPSLVIALGNVPFWALSSFAKVRDSQKPSGYKVPAGIGDWRGSQLFIDRLPNLQSQTKLLPIYHPAACLRQWYLRPIIVHDLRHRVPLALEDRWTKPLYSAIIPHSAASAAEWLGNLLWRLPDKAIEIAVDLETTGRRAISCIGFATSPLEAICIPLVRPNESASGGFIPRWTLAEEMEIVRLIRQILNHPNAKIIGQNFAYDIQFLSKFWLVKPRLHWDTMIAQHVLFPNTPKDLGYLASMYSTDYFRYWKEDSKEWEAKGDWNSHLLYNCDDCIYTFKIYQAQVETAKTLGLAEQVRWKLSEWHLACEMSARGVLVDSVLRADMVMRVDEAVRARQEAMQRMVPAFCRPDVKKGARPFYSSAKQQQELLYTMLGLKSVFHRKTGNITANDEAIESLKIRYPYLSRLFDCILELRSLRVFSSNYLAAAVDADGRWHCSFNVAGAKTMRWSSSENAFGRGLNLQNISTGTEED